MKGEDSGPNDVQIAVERARVDERSRGSMGSRSGGFGKRAVSDHRVVQVLLHQIRQQRVALLLREGTRGERGRWIVVGKEDGVVRQVLQDVGARQFGEQRIGFLLRRLC